MLVVEDLRWILKEEGEEREKMRSFEKIKRWMEEEEYNEEEIYIFVYYRIFFGGRVSELRSTVAVTITDSEGATHSYIVSQDRTLAVRPHRDCLIPVGAFLVVSGVLLRGLDLSDGSIRAAIFDTY